MAALFACSGDQLSEISVTIAIHSFPASFIMGTIFFGVVNPRIVQQTYKIAQRSEICRLEEGDSDGNKFLDFKKWGRLASEKGRRYAPLFSPR